jgi:hypothetical protein
VIGLGETIARALAVSMLVFLMFVGVLAGACVVLWVLRWVRDYRALRVRERDLADEWVRTHRAQQSDRRWRV